MKVLYFHQYFSTRQGGSGTRSYEMAKRLIDRGHSVRMVCAQYATTNTGLTGPYKSGKREGIVDGINVVELELPCSNRDGLVKRSLTFAKFAAKSSAQAYHCDADVVFATSTPLTVAIPGLVAKYMRRRPFVFEVRDLWPELPKAMEIIKNPMLLWLLGILEKRAYKGAEACIGLSPGITDGIAKHIPADKVSLIPNGCDLDLYSTGMQGPWRPDGIETSDFLAIFAGTHGPANGLDAVLDMAQVLMDKGRTDIKILLVGDGKSKDALVRRKIADNLYNVIFHAPVPKNELAGLLCAADAGLQVLADIPAFYFGTSPNKFFDYLAVGLPVLNNYPGWVADLITNNKCGIAVPSRDPFQFASALERMADGPSKKLEMGKAARGLGEREFSRTQLADKFVDLLEGVVANNN